ncbi:MAG: hypothetical protein HN392_03210 [Anaerolineae bacterium]|jgi:hypothetical protein|nr:hypothetical protein [Anaerolineae bacterium]MBT7781665.1 hypothetical protein [Anaerolineae bacterium]
MYIPYHQQILQEALEKNVSPHALKIISEANAKQDHLRGQIGHDEYHFDNNAFEESYAYVAENHTQIHTALKNGHVEKAWKAFGRLSHAAQDFYAHSNYIPLWLAEFDEESTPPASEVIHDNQNIIKSSNLHSGKLYYPLEILSFIPWLKKYVMPHLPKDSHAWMNIDSPKQGKFFAYAFIAAVKITKDEWHKATTKLSQEERNFFQDL